MSSEYERYVNSDFVTHLHPKEFATFDVLGFWKEKETMFSVLSSMAMDLISVQASSVASESAFSTSGKVLIRRTRLTPTSLEMCMCLKDYLDAKERKQDKCPLEIALKFEEDVFDDEAQRNKVIPLFDEKITLDASSEGTLSPGGSRFVRDRHVECFLWTVGGLPEPKYSATIIEMAKTTSILLLLDDIYDTYGSYDDLLLFTKIIQRWDMNEIKQLPEYMQACYMALYNTNTEICDKVLRERGLYVQPILCKTWIDIVEGYMMEVERLKIGTIPNFKDCIDNAVTTSGSYMAFVHKFFLICDGVTKQNMTDLLDPNPKFFTLAGTILRLWDDLGTVKEEQERGEVLSSIQWLIKEKKITCDKDETKQVLELIHGLWKDLNGELVAPNVVLLPMIRVAVNMSRTSQVVYQHNEDSYLSSVKDHVKNLFFKPIHI
nr:probable terpene synthase 11 [Tanacetum cinerariifolium]